MGQRHTKPSTRLFFSLFQLRTSCVHGAHSSGHTPLVLRSSAQPRGGRSIDGFFYTPLDNLTRHIAKHNGCGSDAQWRVYPTPRDGDMHWHCIEPFGACATGASVVRCSSLVGHMWPSFYKAVCQVEECAHTEFAELAWAFLSNHPRVHPHEPPAL